MSSFPPRRSSRGLETFLVRAAWERRPEGPSYLLSTVKLNYLAGLCVFSSTYFRPSDLWDHFVFFNAKSSFKLLVLSLTFHSSSSLFFFLVCGTWSPVTVPTIGLYSVLLFSNSQFLIILSLSVMQKFFFTIQSLHARLGLQPLTVKAYFGKSRFPKS